MKNEESDLNFQIEELYTKYSVQIYKYILSKVSIVEDAENLSQDVWLKLLEHNTVLNEETALSYVYRVAANLVNDYLRKKYYYSEAKSDLMFEMESAGANSPEHEVSAAQILQLELSRVDALPRQRRAIYIMSRFDEKSVAEIATELSLSLRTVENHLRLGRHDVRNYLRAAV